MDTMHRAQTLANMLLNDINLVNSPTHAASMPARSKQQLDAVHAAVGTAGASAYGACDTRHARCQRCGSDAGCHGCDTDPRQPSDRSEVRQRR